MCMDRSDVQYEESQESRWILTGLTKVTWEMRACDNEEMKIDGHENSEWAQDPEWKSTLPLVWRSDTPEFFGHRLHTSLTVEESTAGLGRTLRTGRPLVGGLSFDGVSGCA